MFKGPMKNVYREQAGQADDIGDDNSMAYNGLFTLSFVAPYVRAKRKYRRRPRRR